MPIRNPAPHDPNALRRDLDPQARGLLRDDTPNHWKENLHALSNLSSSEVLNPSTFDQLTAVNKEVVIAHVEHVLDVLNKRYYRRGVPPDIDVFQIRKGVFFVRTEEMWDKMIGLAKRPGAGGATATDPAAETFWIRDSWLSRRQNLNGLRPQRHRSLTARSLGNIEVTIVDSLHHSQFAFLQIDVSPTQRQQLANDLRNALAL